MVGITRRKVILEDNSRSFQFITSLWLKHQMMNSDSWKRTNQSQIYTHLSTYTYISKRKHTYTCTCINKRTHDLMMTIMVIVMMMVLVVMIILTMIVIMTMPVMTIVLMINLNTSSIGQQLVEPETLRVNKNKI